MNESSWVDRITAISTAIAALGAAGSAYYAARQARVSTETMYRQLRPYVSVAIEDVSAKDQKLNVAFKVSNHGQTPAFRAGVIHVDFKDRRLPTKADILRAKYSSAFSSTTIQNGGGSFVDNYAPVRSFKELGSEDMQLYFVLMVQFDDVFEKKHTSAFCFQFYRPTPDGKIARSECPILGWEGDIIEPKGSD